MTCARDATPGILKKYGVLFSKRLKSGVSAASDFRFYCLVTHSRHDVTTHRRYRYTSLLYCSIISHTSPSPIPLIALITKHNQSQLLSFIMPFQYKKVLIIGATSGIGKALASRFVQEGSSVIVVGRRKESLEGFVHEHGRDRSSAVPFDVTELEKIPSFVIKLVDTIFFFLV